MSDKSPDACIRRIENAVGVLALRRKGTDLMPDVGSDMLDHFTVVQP